MTTEAPLGWRDDWATTEFEIELDSAADNLLRVRIRHAPGRGVVRFAVQYEARVGGERRRRAVVRGDSAHGRAHRDLLDPAGTVARKDWIDDRTYDQVLTDAIDEVKRDWHACRAAFERMMEP